MAVRLPVIMIQTSPPSTAANQLSEAIVGELIGLPEVDLVLVGGLTGLDAGSTDLLTLESINGDCAVLDWSSPAETMKQLQRLGVAGNRSPHPHDLAADSVAAGRRVYLFDLNGFASAEELCRAIAALKSSRQVRTFSLSMPASRSTSGNGTSSRSVATGSSSPAYPAAEPPPGNSSRASEAGGSPSQNGNRILPADLPGAPSGEARTGAKPSPTRPGPRRQVDLDDLVDRLDELDP